MKDAPKKRPLGHARPEVKGAQRARRLRAELGITVRKFPIWEVAEAYFGPVIKSTFHDENNAACVKQEQSWLIFVDVRDGSRRQAFSIAHEIGHITDPERASIEYRCEISEWGVTAREKETECNAFAAELLMPEETFRADIEKTEYSFSGAGRLAREHGTSLVATVRRMVELADFVSVLLSSDMDGFVQWWWRSAGFFKCAEFAAATKPLRVPPDSAAKHLIDGWTGDKVRDLRVLTMPWCTWLPEVDPYEGYVLEQAFYVRAKPWVLSLLVPGEKKDVATTRV